MTTIVAAVGGGNWTTGATWVGGSAPTAADDAVLDGTSGNVTIDTGAVCRSLDCTGYTGTLTHSSATTLTIGDGTAGAGDIALKLVAGMTYSRAASNSSISFVSTSATVQTINTAGKGMGNFVFNGVGGSWQLSSSLTGGSGNPSLTLTNGALDFNDQAVSFGSISTNNSNVRTLSLGNGTITLTADATVWNGSSVTNFTLNQEASTIVLSGTGAGNKTFAGGGKTFNDLSISSGGSGIVIFSGANTFASFTINAPKSVRFPAGATTTVSSFNAVGTAGNLITIDSSSAGSAATLSDASGTNSCDFLSLQDSTAAGGATWLAGANSTNVSGNSGWIFNSIPAATLFDIFLGDYMPCQINQANGSVSASTSSANAAYPNSNSNGVIVYNNASTLAFVASGDSNVTAASTNQFVPPGVARVFEKRPTDTHMAAILASGSGTVYFSPCRARD